MKALAMGARAQIANKNFIVSGVYQINLCCSKELFSVKMRCFCKSKEIAKRPIYTVTFASGFPGNYQFINLTITDSTIDKSTA